MNYLVYIALEKFKDTPILKEDWLKSARACADLVLDARSCVASLKNDPSACLRLNQDGLIEAQTPTRELILVMFNLAEALQAKVYSQRFKRYRSVNDWQRRTKKYRSSPGYYWTCIKKYLAGARRSAKFWITVLAVALATAWLLTLLASGLSLK